jgi:hypothetical protein
MSTTRMDEILSIMTPDEGSVPISVEKEKWRNLRVA